MNWRDWYPEGSTVFIGREQYMLRHNEHDLGVDLYRGDQRVMTIAPEYVPVIASGIKYPEVTA
ncbi:MULTISPECIES: hypothetical protein [unclassified Shinella]|uniref:hypothetical protein n=1 Tax=unclassified Shinella TaxID=2643062 RepID=UPI00225D179D|nr:MULTISPECIES: hypothetical protein [unclassified Shinella]MCO5138298.1 hypothetical protein [Shinella sp.]MDC7255134.1 hypothetical protein [Shinella sp. YE25]CAI0337894.1 conserved hypothetical protein [Rhizobiaceae bacterium]CAK7256364.1 conserved protein of unknown function [Shinella sp. WSC3-e]